MNRVAFSVFGFSVYWYSICIAIGMIIGVSVVLKESKKRGISNDTMFDIVFYTLIWALIGARVYYVLFNLDYYLSDPVLILDIRGGGLAIHGGIFAGILYLLYYVKKHKNISLINLLDICAPGLIIGQIVGRFGNFFNGEAYGPVVSRNFLENLHLPSFIIDGMYIEGEYHHPTFLYEAVWNFVGLIIILVYRRRKNIKSGEVTGIYLSWYSFGRFFIEGLRQDSLMLGGIRVAQLVSLAMFIVGIYLIVRARYKKNYLDKI